MGIINPRPQMRGAERRAIENNLRLHSEFMRRLEALGFSREEASRRAFMMIKAGGNWIEPIGPGLETRAGTDGCLRGGPPSGPPTPTSTLARKMTNERISELTGLNIDEMLRTAETGSDWAEIAAAEAMAHDLARRETDDNSQFGVGA